MQLIKIIYNATCTKYEMACWLFRKEEFISLLNGVFMFVINLFSSMLVMVMMMIVNNVMLVLVVVF